MMTSRREFLGMTAGAWLTVSAIGRGDDGRAAEPKTILMLGGTGFLGPQTVEAALRRGHKVTLFNCGKTRPGLFPDLEKLHRDRDKDDLMALEGRKWDAVVDTSANVPRWVKKAAVVLGPNVGHYIYISSVSAHADLSRPGIDEAAPVATIDDPTTEKIDGLKDLVTGKRFWSHGQNEPGSDKPARLYWFEASRRPEGKLAFTPREIDDQSGIGTQFVVADFNGDGLLDIVTANKKGVFLFEQVRPAQ